ncbi:GH3 domain-containing protein-like [Diadema setosum]|uniref:GH3 domain-containing protein-like n=1 Tax=Diadema setosum TaxID=31175 RepID=UPI003B3B139C
MGIILRIVAIGLGVPVVAGCTAVAAIAYDFKRLKKAESHTPESAAKQYAVNKVFEFVGRGMSKALDADSKRCQEVRSHHFMEMCVPIYSCLYAASEGLIGINIWPRDEERRYLLVPRSMFCEFIPIEHSDEDQPSTLLMNEVEKGATYELVLTNMSGFYRYRFGDVVRVTDFYNKTPVVEFLYRQGQLLNLRGEKMSEDVMYQTIQKTIGDWGGVTLSDYTTMESPLLGLGASDKCPHYEVFLELEGKTPSSGDLTLLDQNLRESSFVYNSFREKGSISPIRVHLVRPGTFRRLREHLLANTQASINQIKIPRVLKVDAHAQILLDSEVV